jgi:biotin carboxyl carrier protein
MAAAASGQERTQGEIRANMPGLVTTVNVTLGQRVTAGEVVAVLDSMKLLYSYESPIDGEVSAVSCQVGDTVSGGQLMVEVTPIEAS